MRILHVLTVLTPDGAYGGPARVAFNQCKALRYRGHDVVLVAGAYGFDSVPTEFDGQPVVAFPAQFLVRRLGYASMYARGMRRWIRENADSFDAIHLHLARDLVMLPAANAVARRGLGYVVQPHGMIVEHPSPVIMVCDVVQTRRALRGAGTIFVLNDREGLDLKAVAGSDLSTTVLPNGVPAQPADAGGDKSRSEPPEVLFLARLHPRKRPLDFVKAAVALLESGVDAQFVLVGPAEGAEVEVDRLIEQTGFPQEQLRREGAVSPDSTARRMSAADVYVLPAEREPFGMTIVEALAVGTPVIISSDGGLAAFVDECGGGLTYDGTVDGLTAALRQMLSDPASAADMGERGRQAVVATYGMDGIAKTLEEAYADLGGHSR